MSLMDMLTKWKFEAEAGPLDSLSAKLDAIKGRLDIIGGIQLIHAVTSLTERFGDFAESLQTGAAAAGLSVEALQQLQFAGSQSGVKAEEMTGALGHLSRSLYAAREGSKETLAAFAKIGISSGQVAGFKTSRDALLALSDRFKDIKDPIQKQALAMNLLGRGSSNMVKAMSEGSGAMKDLEAEALRVGAVLTGPQAAALNEAADAVGKLWQVVKVFSASLVAGLAPAIVKTVNHLLDLWRANRDLIEINLQEWFGNITYAMGFIVSAVTGAVVRFRKFINAHEDLIKWGLILVTVFQALGMALPVMGAALAVLKTPLSDIAAGFIKLVKWAAAMTLQTFIMIAQFALVAVAIGAIVASVHDLYTILTGGRTEDMWLFKLAKKAGVEGIFDLGKVLQDSFASKVHPIAGNAASLQSAMAVPVGQSGAVMDVSDSAMAELMGTVNISAPVNVNVPPGTDPSMVGSKVKEGMDNAMSRILREAHRSTVRGPT